jgi:glucosamine--fructose-6-phosphate aminotransferase (isomerizing)
MCGIVGYVGPRECTDVLLDGLRRLEYRGYDSAGMAVLGEGGLQIVRTVGKLSELEGALRRRRLPGRIGIGHTRWATHGRPSEANAHPHVSGKVAVVHNGIIENHLSLKKELAAEGFRFTSDTDTEIVGHLVRREMDGGADLPDATLRALSRVRGAYAIAVLCVDEPGRIVAAKSASPLVVGLGDGEAFCASDVPAILTYTDRMVFLDEGEMAIVDAGAVRLVTLEGLAVARTPRRIQWSLSQAEKGGFKHFMQKEIHEQPRAVEDTLRGRIDLGAGDVVAAEMGLEGVDVASVRRVVFLACGTSFHASLYGRHLVEKLARLEAVAELASEFRQRDPVVGPGDLVVAVSQSGETADTLAAVRLARERGARVVALANVVDSAIPRAADAALYTHAGPEIGVASTKCFTAQLAAMALCAVYLGRRRGSLDAEAARAILQGLVEIPQLMRRTLSLEARIREAAPRWAGARDFLFLGRGPSFPVALEGALKLKEISYVHAEGYAAGEMKHGPIALVDASVPVVVVMPRDASYEKTAGNLQEVRARDGRIVAVVTEGDSEVDALAEEVFAVPPTIPELSPLLTVVPLQLLAYHVADFKGTDVDQPRNLAKTVTVE